MPIESGWVSKALENAQTKVEGHNFDIRKHVVEYDDVMNTHRDVIYTERNKVLEGADMRANVFGMVEDELREIVALARCRTVTKRPGTSSSCSTRCRASSRLSDEITPRSLRQPLARRDRGDAAGRAPRPPTTQREEEIGADNMRLLERLLMLQIIDRLWVEHLTAMDEMRQGIGLQAYGQTDPLVAYKREAHDMWEQLLENIRNTIAHAIYHVEITVRPPQPPPVIIETGPTLDGDEGASVATQAIPVGADGERAQRAVAAATGIKAPPRNLRTNQPVDGGGNGARTAVATKKPGATSRARAAAARSTRSATGWRRPLRIR